MRRRFGDRRPALLIPNALVKNLPNQTTEPVGDGTDGLGVSEARNESTVDDGEDRALSLHGGVRGLIEDATHLAVAFGAAVTVVHTRDLRALRG